MPDNQLGNSNEDSPLNSTLQKLDSTLEQQTATAISSINLPTFAGLQNEDVREFLNRFKVATFVLSDKHRCLALNKCLAGTANTWAKANIKAALAGGQWKIVKKAFVERFGPADVILTHREKLNSMRYQDSSLTTLLGYVEKFIAQYKKAYTSQSDSDAIMSLRLNLPNTIIRSLNLLDDTWSKYTSCADLYKLVRRYEENIMPFEQANKQQAVLDKAGVKELLNQLRTEFMPQQQARELLGAIAITQKSNDKQNFDKYRYQSQPRRIFYKRRYPYSEQQSQQTASNLHHKQSKQASIETLSSDKHHDADKQLIQSDTGVNPYKRPNKPPSPCYYCAGDHWNSDCSRRAKNLN